MIVLDSLKERLFQIIGLFEDEQINVEAICCDLGPLNKALLKRLGITAKFSDRQMNSLSIPNY